MERPIRSVVKAITWRMIGTLDTFLISWLITGEVLLASGIALAEVFTKSLLFVGHEQAWSRVKWGYVIHGYNQKKREKD
jgi:uncharacterized membrane protein